MRKKTNNNKIVLITGSSRGIGYTTVELLASKGFLIYAGVRSLAGAEKLKILAQKNSNVRIKEIDLKDVNSIKRLAKDIKKEEGKIDIIINNASIIVFGPVETVSIRQFYDQFQVNLFGPMLLTQELLPLMRKQKSGHIIFLGSTSGVESHGMYGTYAASKFALEAICHALAVNLYQWNIKVSVIELTATATLIAEKTLEVGNRKKINKNPYSIYTKNSLAFLKNLLINGASPQKIAETILNVINNPKNQLRYFATEQAKNIFDNSLTDSTGIKWQQEAAEAMHYFK